MKQKRIILIGIFILILVSLVYMIISGLFSSDKYLRLEHCSMMPGLDGCEDYRGKYVEQSAIFERSIIGLSSAEKTQEYNLDNGNSLELSAEIVKKKIDGKEIRMFGYNGQIPGPLIKIHQGDTIYVNFTNNIDQDTTVHWHGLRLENENDGVPGVTQEPIKPGQSFMYKLDFPDSGIYWYHPHVREDYQQELGLYGNILVEPSNSELLNPVNKEQFMMLDDIQLDGQDIKQFYEEKIKQVLMGRFGDFMLINGEDSYNLSVKKGEIVRFYLTNTANTRIFNFSISGQKLKVIGSDSGTYEQETWDNAVVIAPSERRVVEVLFDNPGTYNIMNINPVMKYNLGKIQVLDIAVENKISNFEKLRSNILVKEELKNYKQYINKNPDVELKLDIKFPGMSNGHMMGSMMHIEESGIEWEDVMKPANFASSNNTIDWLITDSKTGKSNMAIDYNWKIGDKVKIRIFNDPNSMHPMQHPIHFHGQRFLVLAVDGVPNDNLVWKDTVLVPSGKKVDILLDVTNPGDWMAHCHIAEHLSDGMMFMFNATK